MLHAKALYRTRNQANVELVLGDSALELLRIVDTLEGPALFWLDAHYSGGGTSLGNALTPVVAELQIILSSTNAEHVVTIDDARAFYDSKRSGYPEVDEIYSAAEQHNYSVTEMNDVFHLLPRG